MFVNPSAKCHLFTDLRASWGGQEDLGEVALYAHYASASGCGPYIHHKYFVFGKFLYLEIATGDRSAYYVTHGKNKCTRVIRTFVCFLSSVRTPKSRRSRK
jgi:hypothetical protein